MEFAITGLKGGRRWLETHAVPLRGADGEVRALLGITRDITERKQAEVALRVSESRHRRLIESNIIGVMVATTDGRINESNDLFLQMVGYTREDSQAGRVRWDTMTPPEWRAADEHIRAELIRAGGCAPVEKEFLRKDGSRVPIRASVAMLEGTAGECICLIEDLTSRKRAEEALRQSEARIRSVFEQASDGIYIISAENRYLEANASGLELLGYTRDELLRMSVADVLAPHEVARLAVEPPRMMSGVPHLAEWDHVRKDGSTFPGEVSARRLDDQSYLAIVRDLTSRRQAEAALRESEEKFAKAFRNSPDAVLLTTLDGHILDANAGFTRLTGYAIEEVRGRSTVDLGIWADAVDRQRFIAGLREHGRVVELEAPFRNRAGELRVCVASGELMDLAGQPAIIGVVRDITERKRTDEEVRRSRGDLRALLARLQFLREEERTRIARDLHDQLGQLLTGLKMDAAWLATKVPKDDARIVGKAKEMAELTDDIIRTVQRISSDLRPRSWMNSGSSPRSRRRCRNSRNAAGFAAPSSARSRTSRSRPSRAWRSTASARRRSPTWSGTRTPRR